MSKLKMEKITNTATVPTYDSGVFTFFTDVDMNRKIEVGAALNVSSGIKVTIPEGHVGIVGLVPDFVGPDVGIVLAEGLRFIQGKQQEIKIRVINSGTYARVIGRGVPLCNLIILPVTEFAG
jgi:dUTPase